MPRRCNAHGLWSRDLHVALDLVFDAEQMRMHRPDGLSGRMSSTRSELQWWLSDRELLYLRHKGHRDMQDRVYGRYLIVPRARAVTELVSTVSVQFTKWLNSNLKSSIEESEEPCRMATSVFKQWLAREIEIQRSQSRS